MRAGCVVGLNGNSISHRIARFSPGRPLSLGYLIHDNVLNNGEFKRGSTSLIESFPTSLPREGDKGGRLPNNLSESQIVRVWQHQLLDGTRLVTEGGEPIEVIYPGRINDDQGADFRDAVITTSRGLIRGDIEIHVRSSSWREHGHHRDVAYNRVILHVVMWHNARTVTNLQNGREVPILTLSRYIKIPASQGPGSACSPATLNMPCPKIAQRLNTGTVTGFLDSAGEERFLAKVDGFRIELARTGAGQVLYQGIMGALGYSRNKLPFLELARRLPLPVLESITQGEISDEECLAHQQALILGTAGLLPSQRQDWYRGSRHEDEWVDKLERPWASSHRGGVMSPYDWHLFKVRPNNSPVRRLVAISYLILRYREKGILEELVNLVKEVPVSRGCHRLAMGLLVTTNGYWESHFDFGSGSWTGSPTLLGGGRAADIAVNVLLPFTSAWSRATSQPDLEKKAFELYRGYPRLTVNSVERHMTEQLGLNSRLISSAQRQQGIIHIYNNLCTQGRCNDCSLSQLKAGNYVKV